jgi:TRAP-type C4-dicarboxylate transport system permease small subunit
MLGLDSPHAMLVEPIADQRPGKTVIIINWLVETAAAILMAALAILVFVNAAGRYAFARPLPWTEELSIYILVWLGALGIVMAGMRQTLICCDIVRDRVSSGTRRLLTILCAIAGSGVMLYCAWLTWEYLGFFGDDRSPILGMPKGIVIVAVFFALISLAVTLLVPIFGRR